VSAAALLDVNNIEVVYDRVILVLKGVSITVPEGGMVALLGANGAGKSTTLKAISNLVRVERGAVTRGTITFAGSRLDTCDPADIVRRGVVQVMEGRRPFEHLTVEENLLTGAYVRRDAAGVRADLETVYRYFPRLAERRRVRAGYASGGEQQMLAIGRALMTNPRLLILDEATEGLAPLIRAEIWGCLAQLKSAGLAVLVIDKNVDVLTRIADRHYFIERGRIVWSGTSVELARAPDVQHRYMGV
jgi:branched-chain amino acid transport system ATP-binding protein